jgi:hypothetical protein
MKSWRQKLRRLSGRDLVLVAEAVVMLAVARAAVGVVPFRMLARFFGKQHAETGNELPPDDLRRVRRLGQLLRASAAAVPWECKCLTQSVAGRLMLVRRRIPSTLYFGVRTDEDGAFDAHAWLRCGSYFVTGGDGHESFTVLTHFADPV